MLETWYFSFFYYCVPYTFKNFSISNILQEFKKPLIANSGILLVYLLRICNQSIVIFLPDIMPIRKLCSNLQSDCLQRHRLRSTKLLASWGRIYVITQDVGPEIWTPYLPLEGKFLLIALVIVWITLNMIVRQMPLNVR